MTDTTYIATQTIHDIQNVSDGFTVKDIVFIIIALVNIAILGLTAWYVKQSPIEAVKTAELLQTNRNDADRKYQNKFSIFILVYGDRHLKGFSQTFNLAVNQIPVVFYDNQRVIVDIPVKLTTLFRSKLTTLSSGEKVFILSGEV